MKLPMGCSTIHRTPMVSANISANTGLETMTFALRTLLHHLLPRGRAEDLPLVAILTLIHVAHTGALT
eukprot:6378572-Alexandrium_andersonii.AAC.1